MDDLVPNEAAAPAPELETTAVPAPEETVTPETPAEQEAVKSFTQEELDAIVGKRLAREQRKWEREQQQRLSEQQARQVPPAPQDFHPSDFASYEAYADALAVKNDTLDQKFSDLTDSVSDLKIALGEQLAPAFGEFAVIATQSIDAVRLSIDDLFDANQRLAEYMTGFSFDSPNVNFSTADDIRAAMEESMGASVSDPFQSLTQSAQKYAERGVASLQEAAEAKKKADGEKLESERRLNSELQAEKEKDLQNDAERAARKAETDAKRREEELARDEEQRIEQLLLEDERFEEDLQRLTERLQGFDEVENEYKGLAELRELSLLKTKARTAEQKQKIDLATAKATERAYDLSAQSALDSLQTVFSEETAVGKAIFVIRKAQAIANTIASTQQAMALARATVPPPAGDALAARYALQGAINVGVIAATAITGAADGGIVKGGVFGKDTQPFMLAKDEIIVPSRLNPLSPNFDQSFGGAGFAGGGNVKVQIGLEENASKILTVKQREDRALGIQR